MSKNREDQLCEGSLFSKDFGFMILTEPMSRCNSSFENSTFKKILICCI